MYGWLGNINSSNGPNSFDFGQSKDGLRSDGVIGLERSTFKDTSACEVQLRLSIDACPSKAFVELVGILSVPKQSAFLV